MYYFPKKFGINYLDGEIVYLSRRSYMVLLKCDKHHTVVMILFFNFLIFMVFEESIN